MRLSFVSIFLVVGCVQFPDLDIPAPTAEQDTGFPSLTEITTAPEITNRSEAEGDLQDRADALNARADILRETETGPLQ